MCEPATMVRVVAPEYGASVRRCVPASPVEHTARDPVGQHDSCLCQDSCLTLASPSVDVAEEARTMRSSFLVAVVTNTAIAGLVLSADACGDSIDPPATVIYVGAVHDRTGPAKDPTRLDALNLG